MFDLVIRNGRIIDGTGNPWFAADVAVAGGRIQRIAPGIEPEGCPIIDASGLVVAPGFIDMHTHSDLRVFKHPEEETKLLQGITTALLGQDGLSVAPCNEDTKGPMAQRVAGLLGTYLTHWPWDSMSSYLNALEALPLGANSMMLVPHGAVRALAVGWDNRPATEEELAKMKDLLAQSLEEGACGLSTGLFYPPCSYAERGELVELCRVTRSYGGFLVVHVRDEGDNLMESLQEVIGICLEADCPLHISHLKVSGKKNWGRAAEALMLLEEAREQGLELTFDQYPYIAGSTMLDAVLPPRFLAGGTAAMLENLKRPEVRQELTRILQGETQERFENLVKACGWDGIVVSSVASEANLSAEGKNIASLAAELGKTPVDVVCDLLIAENNAVTQTMFYGSEDDVKKIMQSEYMTLCTDGIAGGKPHPRVYGSTARFLGKYVREEGALSLPQAVRRLTSLPAQRLRLQDRGLVREGMVADITVFDPETIRDRGTYADPNQYPAGIEYVLVAGQVAVEQGRLTGVRAGQVLRRR